ncbi:hypothetical protein PVL29_017588 [Vitis rotundifolia]|uniref:Uncharacterized protein n=1 Tax=Vitis rotundifolia TaxID=103349 RepID=A0AA38ZBP8_VITRO|nr:hypothetical protein PVL29_017588 [Vitis rotundifolia]
MRQMNIARYARFEDHNWLCCWNGDALVERLLLESFIITGEAVRLLGCRTFAAGGGKEKKGSKGGGTRDPPKVSTLSKADNFFSKEKSIKTPTIKNTL